jgi:hypothetical protein
LEIPLTSFSQLNSNTNIAQLIFSGTPSGAGTVYIDNVLFFNNEGAGILEKQSTVVEAFPNPCSEKITLYAKDSPMYSIQLFGLDGTLLLEESPNSLSYSIDLSSISVGIYLLRISHGNNPETLRIIKK